MADENQAGIINGGMPEIILIDRFSMCVIKTLGIWMLTIKLNCSPFSVYCNIISR
jgi:hypothetical protein